MLELTNKRLVSILWMLKNKDKTWSISELRRAAAAMINQDDTVYAQKKPFPIVDIGLTYKPTHTFIKELEKNGFVAKESKTSEYRVAKAGDLVKFISLSRPFAGFKSINYHSPTEFQETLKIVNGSKLNYAFTVFAGSELYRPYVKTNQVHVYISESDKQKWSDYLISKKCMKAEKSEANLFLIPVKENFIFRFAKRIKGFLIAASPILLADLLSFGGLAEEQAQFLMEEWLDNRL